MKIIFIGAGMATLVAAYELAKGGADVTIFEKETEESVSYDWHDDVNGRVFEKFGLPMPERYFTKRNWTFYPPSEKVGVTLNIPESELDLSIERRPLAIQYIKRAREVCEVKMGVTVDSLIIENGVVRGVVAEGAEHRADLTVDCSGVRSPFRESALNVGVKEEDVFVAYRGFHKTYKGTNTQNRAYLKHLGEDGISWNIPDPSGLANILIGRVGKLPKSTFINAYNALKVSNPDISDEVVRGGIFATIPIRYPLERMCCEGYAAIGDAAFMTIPMIGSGIENSINAGMILAKTVLELGTSMDALWEYQVRYFLDRGALHMGVDILKRWLLSAKPKDLDWLFEKGVISSDDMAKAATGKLITLSFFDLVQKLCKGISDLPLLIRLNSVLQKTKKAKRIGMRIPKTYDPKKIAAWQRKVKKLYE